MKLNGISIYQFIFFVILLNDCTVQGAYMKFVDDPAQRKLCGMKESESVCKADNKCMWYDFQ